MIYISTSCIKANTIKESVISIANEGFKNIELSGGTKYYPSYETDLMELKNKFQLNYLIHNYFPPPKKPFVINLASLNDEIYTTSINHCKNAIRLSRRFECQKYGIHAGFLLDISVSEIGKTITNDYIFEKKESLKRFSEAWESLLDYSKDKPKLYIENNVFSNNNKQQFDNINPFLFSSFEGFKELNRIINFNPLIDLAHLKVSAKSLSLDFNEQLTALLPLTDYIHLSDNNGLQDQNKGLNEGSDILEAIKNNNVTNKTITLEVYDGIDNMIISYNNLIKCIN